MVFRLTCVIAAAMVTLVHAAPGQQQQIISTFGLVRVAVSVTDGRGRHQAGLTAADFEILEDGVPQKASAFEEANTPLGAVMLLDTSDSIGKSLPAVQDAAAEFVNLMRPTDVAKVIEFNTMVTTSQDSTSDKAALDRAIRTISLNGATALLNAIYQGLKDAVRQRDLDPSKRPAVIVLSDGDDTASMVTNDIVIAFARRSEIPVYAVRMLQPAATEFGDREFARLVSERETPGAMLLSQLAQETGGRFILAKPNELKRFYTDVADELHQQYRLGYISSNRKLDGRWRTITVRLKGRDNLRLKYRAGYYGRTG
jgi:Ca-activated chloride channel family protein